MKASLKKFLRFSLLVTMITMGSASSADYNDLILEKLQEMPKGGTYARYRRELPTKERFNDLYRTVGDLNGAIQSSPSGKLKVSPDRAKNYSFCSSATYLLFAEVIEELQSRGTVSKSGKLSKEIADLGDKTSVIHGKMDGIGIFGHWNADGPGTAVLFERLDLGPNFSSYSQAKPGDFMKIWWNGNIGKGESGHLVVFMGEVNGGSAVKVWSSQTTNSNGTSGYGQMVVDKSRIKRVVFSRLESPENLEKWLNFSETEKKSDYLIRNSEYWIKQC